MTFEDYQQKCMRTWNASKDRHVQLENCMWGLGEVGELQNLVKKWRHHGHDLDKVAFIDELGDIAYYTAIAAHLIECPKSRFGTYITYSDDMPRSLVDVMKYASRAQQDMLWAIENNTMIAGYLWLDSVWHCVASLAQNVDSTIQEVMEHNVEKLTKRYPDGFDVERSRNRDE